MTKSRGFFVRILLGAALWATSGRAQNTGSNTEPFLESCISAYEEAQVLRNNGALLKARTQLLVCLEPHCPVVLRSDCAEWLTEVDREVPTLVFQATVGGKAQHNVTVEMDGRTLTEVLDGTAIPVEPGNHAFRFRLPPLKPVEKKLVVETGDKLRVISVAFEVPSTRAAISEPDRSAYRPIPMVTYGLFGVSVAAAGLGTAFYVAAVNDKQRKLETCAPMCSDEQISEVAQRYRLAAGFYIGAGATVVAATITYLLRPTESAPKKQSTSVPVFAVAVQSNEGVLSLQAEF